VGKGIQSGNERRGERTGIRGKKIDTLFFGIASREHSNRNSLTTKVVCGEQAPH